MTAAGLRQTHRAVEKFLTDHRASSKSREAKEMLATLKDEANEILAGGVKMNGKYRDALGIPGQRLRYRCPRQEAKIRALVKEDRYLVALRMFTASAGISATRWPMRT